MNSNDRYRSSGLLVDLILTKVTLILERQDRLGQQLEAILEELDAIDRRSRPHGDGFRPPRRAPRR